MYVNIFPPDSAPIYPAKNLASRPAIIPAFAAMKNDVLAQQWKTCCTDARLLDASSAFQGQKIY